MTRAAELAAAVVASPRAALSRSRIETLRTRLTEALAPIAAEAPREGPLVMTLPLLCRAQTGPTALSSPRGPFAWRPFFVRRSLGAAIVDECLAHPPRSPAEVAVPVLDEAVAAWRLTGQRRFHWEPWLAGLPPGGRAAVLADAVTWATALWSCLDWSAFAEQPLVGGPAEQWTSPRARGVRLTSRVELKVRVAQERSRPGHTYPLAVVSVLGGTPPPVGSAALAYPALVAALCAPWRDPPVRSVGVWPDAGHVESLEVDGAALDAVSDLVVDAVRRWSRIRPSRPGEAAPVRPEPEVKVGVTR